jgi:hypothetical protein
MAWKWHGLIRHIIGMEMAWHGKEQKCQGMEMAWKWDEMEWNEKAWTWHGMAWHGLERHGNGMAWECMEMTWHGNAWKWCGNGMVVRKTRQQSNKLKQMQKQNTKDTQYNKDTDLRGSSSVGYVHQRNCQVLPLLLSII